MASHLIAIDYQDFPVLFTEEGWFNATSVADRFGREPTAWLNQRETAEYIVALASYKSLISDKNGFLQELNEINQLDSHSAASRAKLLRLVKKTGFVKTRTGSPDTGGGTWFHPKLAVPFARWLDVRFAVWCDLQIDSLINRQHPHFDWKRLRHEAASSNRVMNAVLQLHRQMQGKPSAQHHFINEAKLVNWALTGEFQGLNRER